MKLQISFTILIIVVEFVVGKDVYSDDSCEGIFDFDQTSVAKSLRQRGSLSEQRPAELHDSKWLQTHYVELRNHSFLKYIGKDALPGKSLDDFNAQAVEAYADQHPLRSQKARLRASLMRNKALKDAYGFTGPEDWTDDWRIDDKRELFGYRGMALSAEEVKDLPKTGISVLPDSRWGYLWLTKSPNQAAAYMTGWTGNGRNLQQDLAVIVEVDGKQCRAIQKGEADLSTGSIRGSDIRRIFVWNPEKAQNSPKDWPFDLVYEATDLAFP